MPAQTDVVIIGAGSAGLSAAKELARQGVAFVVVEASHRIGGRAYSEEIAPDVWFDLGLSGSAETTVIAHPSFEVKSHIFDANKQTLAREATSAAATTGSINPWVAVSHQR